MPLSRIRETYRSKLLKWNSQDSVSVSFEGSLLPMTLRLLLHPSTSQPIHHNTSSLTCVARRTKCIILEENLNSLQSLGCIFKGKNIFGACFVETAPLPTCCSTHMHFPKADMLPCQVISETNVWSWRNARGRSVHVTCSISSVVFIIFLIVIDCAKSISLGWDSK